MPVRIAEILRDMASGSVDTLALAVDSRDWHLSIFRGLTPPVCDYYAGHYRGEPYRCLRSYAVQVSGDARVGARPEHVAWSMRELGKLIEAGVRAIDGNITLSPAERLRYAVALVSNAFVSFLGVHPYANGNGHAGRLIVWGILGRYGHWPRNFTVEPRPADPPYTELIKRYRDGERLPLERYFLAMLIPPPVGKP